MSQNSKPNLIHSSVPEKNLSQELVTLPDLPFLNIIKNCSLKSLILNIPLVHPRFLTFCDIALKQNHRLILFIGDLEGIQMFKCSFRIGIPFENYLVDNGVHRFYDPEFYRLHIVTLNDEIVDKLVTLMPAISHLEVIISEVNFCLFFRFIRLLNHWASTLKWLKVCSGAFQPEYSRHFLTLIGEINSKLSLLEHLTLDLDGELFEDQPNLDLPILGQLKEFFLQTSDKWNHLNSVCDTFQRQAGKQLTEIGFGLYFVRENILVNHPLAARLKLLAIQYKLSYEHTGLIEQTGLIEPTSFPNLKGYKTSWHKNQSLNSLTSQLCTFKHLQYLELRRLPPSRRNVSVNPFARFSLPTVEILRITFNNSELANEDHGVLKDNHWASLFPSVQIIHLIHSGHFCAKCYTNETGYYIDNHSGFEQSSKRLSCLSQFLAPLTVLPSLRKIFYQRNNDLKNIAEFTGKGKLVKTHAYLY